MKFCEKIAHLTWIEFYIFSYWKIETWTSVWFLGIDSLILSYDGFGFIAGVHSGVSWNWHLWTSLQHRKARVVYLVLKWSNGGTWSMTLCLLHV